MTAQEQGPGALLAALDAQMPVALAPWSLEGRRAGLVIVDLVNGFATVGAGPLAPPEPDERIIACVGAAEALARRFVEQESLPVFVFQDCHDPARPEPPYPPHCQKGSGEENLVPALDWLTRSPGATIWPKDCINGLIGGFDESGRNGFLEWIIHQHLDSVVVVGMCTDICVMDLVTSLLSARNHQMAGRLADVVVYEPGCATYDLPLDAACALGLPETAAHPQAPAHHLGLYVMAARGAVLARAIP